MAPFSEREAAVAEYLIDSINDDGYLADWPELSARLLQEFELTVDDLETIVLKIQDFDPIGVAARDLGECLRLQLEVMSSRTPAINTALTLIEIGRASGRERVCQYVYISVVAVSYKKKTQQETHEPRL